MTVFIKSFKVKKILSALEGVAISKIKAKVLKRYKYGQKR
jgi:hypothetical protein